MDVKRPTAFLLGVLTSALLVSGVSHASTGVQLIKASFDDIGLVVNGKSVVMSAPPFIYNRNVYVPISTVAHALDAKVSWVNKPASVGVQPAAPVDPLAVYYNGVQMEAGITNGKTYFDVPAQTSAYEQATGLIPVVSSTGNVNFQMQSPPALASGSTALMSLKPTQLLGDFSNPALYPHGQLSGYWPASVLGQLYPGQYAIQWAVNPGQVSVIPGLSYALNGQYKTFSASFAVDDLSKNFAGYVQVSVVGNGKTLASTGWIQGGAAPTNLSVDVSNVTTLALQYELKGPNGHFYAVGQTYKAPTVNPDGTTSDPIVVTDLMNAALSS